jgi:hypothetical protein
MPYDSGKLLAATAATILVTLSSGSTTGLQRGGAVDKPILRCATYRKFFQKSPSHKGATFLPGSADSVPSGCDDIRGLTSLNCTRTQSRLLPLQYT